MKKVTYLLIAIINIFPLTQPVWAVDLTAQNSGNGAGSVNQTAVTTSANSSVTQTNDTSVQNTVSLNLNSGGNTSNQNVGQSEIQTGAIESDVGISNATDTNVANLGCGTCVETVEVINQSNGAESQNQAGVSEQTQITVNQSNKTKIENSTNLNANTGQNQANQNVGDALIETGKIVANVVQKILAGENILRDPPASEGSGLEAKNEKNGAFSTNETSINVGEDINIKISNSTEIKNNVQGNLNTSGNHCDQNVGNCEIRTGDITINVKIENEVGKNKTIVSKEKPTPTPSPSPTPSLTPTPTTTLAPTAIPSPTVTPSVSPTPGGGLGPTPSVSPSPSVSPTPTVVEKEGEKEKEAQQQAPSVLQEILEKIIPQVLAAVPQVEKEGEVLGITELPVTGLGGVPYQIGFLDLWPGVLMLGFGFTLRRWEKSSKVGS